MITIVNFLARSEVGGESRLIYLALRMSSISSINAHSLWLLVCSGLAIEHSSTEVHPLQLLPISITIVP